MREIAILIPTIHRAGRLQGVLDNIRETTDTSHRVYFIAENDDTPTRQALNAISGDSVTVIGSYGSCARAVNAGYHASTEPFFAIGNDDVRFHQGWDTAALRRFDDGHHIVGLNDGSGDCKCFTIARRSYIEQHSGVFDKPNTVYHEYTSQCCDTEFAFYAQLRDVWAEAPDAWLEHVHWRFGKADADHPNYQKARETNAADLAVYAERRAQWDPDGITPMAVPGA